MPAVEVPGHGIDLDGFTAECVRHEHALVIGKADAVTAMTDVIDNELLSHGARR